MQKKEYKIIERKMKSKNIEKIRMLQVNEMAEDNELVIGSIENNKRIAFNLDYDYFIEEIYNNNLIPEIELVANVGEVLEKAREELGIIVGNNFINGLKTLVEILDMGTKSLDDTFKKLVAIKDNIEDLIIIIVINNVLFEIYDLLEDKGFKNENIKF